MIRRSGCSRGGRRCRRRRCRWRWLGWSGTGGRSRPSRMISTRSPMRTGSCVCRRWRVRRRRRIGCSSCWPRRTGRRGRRRRCKELLEQAGSKKKNLADWLRDEFFKQHCALFGNRPFVWHIWDGLRDGFSALVNYHRLDRRMLEKLTYTYLGQDWVERQRAEVRDEVAGAEARLAAALELQRKLELILEGEPPYDIYVRWKELHEQPIGWEPDLNDGVRLNIRPFVEAGVLRSPFNIHWKKDRGKNPDGSERAQRHPPHARREARRTEAGRPAMSDTVLDRLVARAIGRAGVQRQRARRRQLPCCGPTRPRSGGRSSTESASTCRSCRSATTTRRRGGDRRTGCAASSPEPSTPAFRTGTPIVYLPGVARSALRAVDSCPADTRADRRAPVPEPVVLASEQPRLVRAGTAVAPRSRARPARRRRRRHECSAAAGARPVARRARRPARDAGARRRLLPRSRQP